MSGAVLGYVVVVVREGGAPFFQRFFLADSADPVRARQRARDAASRLTGHGAPGERVLVCALVADADADIVSAVSGAEIPDLRAEVDRLRDLAEQRALERDSAAQSALTWEAACKEARDERDRAWRTCSAAGTGTEGRATPSPF